jgi:hypothetical protein
MRATRIFPFRVITWFIPVCLAVCLLALPDTFAQRDYAAVLAALPMIAVATARLDEETEARLGAIWPVIAGLLSVLTMALKPQYALAFALPYIFVAASRRDWRVVVAREVLVAAAATVVFWATILATNQTYFSTLVPILMDVYVADRLPISRLLLGFGAVGIMMILISAYLARLLTAERRHAPILLAALGFFIAFLVMGKGWDNHALPFVVTGSLGIALTTWALASGQPELFGPPGKILVGGFALLLCAVGVVDFQRGEPDADIVALLRQYPI